MSRSCPPHSIISSDSLTKACASIQQTDVHNRPPKSITERYPRTTWHEYVLLPIGGASRRQMHSIAGPKAKRTKIPHRRMNTPTRQPIKRPPDPSGLGGGRFRARSEFSLAVWYGSRTRDSQIHRSGALSTELTSGSRQPSLEPIHGTHFADRCERRTVCRWPSCVNLASSSFNFKVNRFLLRRRWESNPLQTALQAVAVPSGSSVKRRPLPRATYT